MAYSVLGDAESRASFDRLGVVMDMQVVLPGSGRGIFDCQCICPMLFKLAVEAAVGILRLAQEIIPRLWLGSVLAANNARGLARAGVTHVLTAAEAVGVAHFEGINHKVCTVVHEGWRSRVGLRVSSEASADVSVCVRVCWRERCLG